jgi:methylated-DNA-[protein]-cysteine S-methyltransferase
VHSTGNQSESDLVALIQATHPPVRPTGHAVGATIAHDRGPQPVPSAPRPQGPVAPGGHEMPVVVGTVETPVGFLSAGLTPRGVAACTFDPEEVVATRLARATSGTVGQDDRRLDPLRSELDRYFEGTCDSFTVPLDLRLLSAFGRAVLRAVRDVPYGSVTTHTALAQRIGSPGALRAVRNSLLTNPLCVLLPCHRAVPEHYPRDTGEYAGGIPAKRYLLTLEELAEPPTSGGRGTA